jgi:ATP-dependent helicase/nuclease subunit B
MNIRFDQEFDGYPWPGPLGDLKARFGHQWVGPQGFLALLETQLGLGGPTNSQAVRAAALVPAVIATPGFWSKSALVDPLGAAKTLLHWRDLLWSAGWRGQGLTPRLNELGTVTRLVPPGPPDRLVAVAASAAKSSTDIEQVELLEDRDVLDPSWQSVLKNLEASGARIVAVKLQVAAAKGDVQAARGTKFEPAADGSLQLFRPLGPHAAAESVAAWLAASGNVDSTVIIGAEPILDAALRRHGLPTVGATPSYRDNSLLEILPLVIQLGWSPADPARALELLTLPNSPIRRGVRGRLVGALTQWPAVESDAWRLALKEGLAQIEDADDRDRLAGRLDVLLRPTVTGTRYPATELRRRASALIQWLQGRSTPEESDQGDYESAIIQCTGFCKLLDLVGLPDLNRPQLQRLLEDATKDAPARPRYSAQAGFCSVASPGAVCGPVERVVWWNFSRDAAERPSSIPLTPVELKALSDANIILPDQTTVAMQINARWGRPLQSATSQLMLVIRFGTRSPPTPARHWPRNWWCGPLCSSNLQNERRFCHWRCPRLTGTGRFRRACRFRHEKTNLPAVPAYWLDVRSGGR